MWNYDVFFDFNLKKLVKQTVELMMIWEALTADGIGDIIDVVLYRRLENVYIECCTVKFGVK